MRHKYRVKVRPFSGAKVSGMVDQGKSNLKDDNLDHILYTVTNDIPSEKTSSEIYKRMAMLLKLDGNSIIVSDIVPRFDNLNEKANGLNNRLALIFEGRNIPFISHTKSIDLSKHLNENKSHLNHNVIKVFTERFSVFNRKIPLTSTTVIQPVYVYKSKF